MASSSGNPTDLRRSGCHSESHQPRTLRTRCSDDTKRRARLGQAPARRNFAQFPATTSSAFPTPKCAGSATMPPQETGQGQTRDMTQTDAGSVPRACRSIHTSLATRSRSTKKCTEPVTPSSGFPTDLRRSDCHSESHQPRALRTRCTQDSRWSTRGRQDPPGNHFSQIATFSFHKGQTAHRCACSSDRREEKRPDPRVRPLIRRAGNAFVHLPDEPSASA